MAPGSYVNAIVTVEWCGRTPLIYLLTSREFIFVPFGSEVMSTRFNRG